MKRRVVIRRSGVLLALALLAVIVAAAALPGIASGASTGDPMSLQEIKTVVQGELSGQKALESSAYVYRGWRVNGGPWFNNVDRLAERGPGRHGLHGR